MLSGKSLGGVLPDLRPCFPSYVKKRKTKKTNKTQTSTRESEKSTVNRLTLGVNGKIEH